MTRVLSFRSIFIPAAAWLLPLIVGGCTSPAREERFAIADDVEQIVVELESGDLYLSGAKPGAADGVAAIEGSDTRFEHHLVGRQLRIVGECPPAAVGCRTVLTLKVPAGVALDLASASGNMTATALKASTVAMNAGSGDVNLAGLSLSALDVVVGSGNLGASAITAQTVAVEAGSGNLALTLDGVTRRTELDTASGDVTVNVPGGIYDLTAESGSGGVSVDGIESRPGADALLTARSGSGDVVIRGR